jgi:hypothetical protein
MNISIPMNEFNKEYVYFHDPIPNTIIENSSFRRIVYSSNDFTLNSIHLYFELSEVEVKQFYNKYKCSFRNQILNDMISNVEKDVLTQVHIIDKTPCYNITNQVNNNFLKMFLTHYTSNYKGPMSFILKISGIWESQTNYGVTYKFVDVLPI